MIEVLKCGAMTTVQDAGRVGYRHLGVVRAGAMDWLVCQQANLLLANAPDAAVLELTLGPLHLKFHQDSAIVLMGADFAARLQPADNVSTPAALSPGFIHVVPAGSILTMKRAALPGMRAFLAIAGGFDVPVVMGSRSTDTSAGFGGFQGRDLQKGDRLVVGSQNELIRNRSSGDSKTPGIRPLAPDSILRALPGPDYSAFTEQAQADFWDSAWRVSPNSNRMGTRLIGSKLSLLADLELASAGTLPGLVQVPPDGQPIILGYDAQTVGGYPRIACVIAADLWQLAYMPPGSTLYFQQVSLQEAHAAMHDQERKLSRLQDSLRNITW